MTMSSLRTTTILLLSLITFSSAVLTWGVWIWNRGFTAFQEAMIMERLPDGLEVGLKYTRIASVDDILRRFVFMILPVVAKNSKQARWGRPLFISSVVDLGSMLLLILVEDDRRGRQLGRSRQKQNLWTLLWLLGVANLSLAVIAPIYALLGLPYMALSAPRQMTYTNKNVPLSLLTIFACIICPCVLLLDPWQRGAVFQSKWLAALGAFPLSIMFVRECLENTVWTVTKTTTATWRNSNINKTHGSGGRRIPRTRQTCVRNVFYISALIACLVRGAAILSIVRDGRVTLVETFVPSLEELRGVDGYSSTCLTFMKADYALSAAALLVIAWSVLAARYPHQKAVLAVAICLAFAVFGAGGVLLAAWAWREDWMIEKLSS